MFIGSGISISPDGFLSFDERFFYPEPEIYYLEDVLEVFHQHPENIQNEPVYYTYFGLCEKHDLTIFQETDFRFDLTVILPGKIKNEYHKTKGRFFSLKPDSHETYGEVAQVLWGEGMFLIQKNNRAGEPEEVKGISARKDDLVFIPPGYGLVLINTGEEPFIVGGLVNTKADFLNEPFLQKKGAAYYYILNENKKNDFIKNTKYTQSTGLELLGAPSVNLPFEGLREKNLYQTFVSNQKLFKTLK